MAASLGLSAVPVGAWTTSLLGVMWVWMGGWAWVWVWVSVGVGVCAHACVRVCEYMCT